jgi:hypothetical protein
MSPRQPLTRLRIADLIVGAVLGGILAVALFPKLGWPAVLLVPLGSVTYRFSSVSFETLERETQKEITLSLEVDPKPEHNDRDGGAA